MSLTHLITSLYYVRVNCISPVVQPAAISSNVDELIKETNVAAASQADIILFPEMAITGYTIGDLVQFPDILNGAVDGLKRFACETKDVEALIAVGLPLAIDAHIFNVAALIFQGSVIAFIPKTFLSNRHEFYDSRWFTSGSDATFTSVLFDGEQVPFGQEILIQSSEHPDVIVGAEICEDLWTLNPPSSNAALSGATILLNLSASNQLVGKSEYREQLVSMQSARTYSVYAYASAGPLESTTDTVFSGQCLIAECGDMLANDLPIDLNPTRISVDVDVQRCLGDRRNSTSFNQIKRTCYKRIQVPWKLQNKNSLQRSINPHPFIPIGESSVSERCAQILQLQSSALAVRGKRSGARGFVVGVSGGLDSTLALLATMKAAEILGLPSSEVTAVSMPGFGTSDRTKKNARALSAMGCTFKEIDISAAVTQHFTDIEHDEKNTNVVYENAQARERTQILMDLANANNQILVGTGDMSEIALGWCTYNADQMSMYNVNSGIPKTLVRYIIDWYASNMTSESISSILKDVLNTPVSPELLPLEESGEISQRTEDVLGPYEVHDFFLYHFLRLHEPVSKICILALIAFRDKYSVFQILDWCEVFVGRFVANQFKRSAMPDGVKIGTVALSPRADLRMPSDATAKLWIQEIMLLRISL